VEFPAAWPSFFHDLIGAAGQGAGLVDMFCRVLISIDEDIISLEIPRWAPAAAAIAADAGGGAAAAARAGGVLPRLGWR
jgi:exportin-T